MGTAANPCAPSGLGRRSDAIAMLLIAIAAARILSTLAVFSATADEANHVAAGMQLIREGRYTWHLDNPPLPRLLFAWPLHVQGAHFSENDPWHVTVTGLFHSSGDYTRSLFLARAGNLVFFLLAALAVWRIARRELPDAAWLPVLLFTTQPVILGFSGIANSDMAGVAGFAMALAALMRLLELSTRTRAVMAGLACGVAAGLKFSNLAFVPAAFAVVGIAHIRRARPERPQWRTALQSALLVALGAIFSLWACYGFVFGSFHEYGLAAAQGAPWSDLLRAVERTPVPMPHFIAGITNVAAAAQQQFVVYAFGMVSREGWWWYFPAVVLFKTTLPVLALACFAPLIVRDSRSLVTLAMAAAILLVAGRTLNLGVRYVLPVYVPLSVAAGVAVQAMLKKNPWWRTAAIALLLWHTGASLRSHPDYFPWFNELGGKHPSQTFIDSNLDWGQDILRLRDHLKTRRIEAVALHVAGMHDFSRLGLPRHEAVDPWAPRTGWVAVGEHSFRIFETQGGFRWLRGVEFERIGTSIRLYHIAPPASGQPQPPPSP